MKILDLELASSMGSHQRSGQLGGGADGVQHLGVPITTRSSLARERCKEFGNRSAASGGRSLPITIPLSPPMSYHLP